MRQPPGASSLRRALVNSPFEVHQPFSEVANTAIWRHGAFRRDRRYAPLERKGREQRTEKFVTFPAATHLQDGMRRTATCRMEPDAAGLEREDHVRG